MPAAYERTWSLGELDDEPATKLKHRPAAVYVGDVVIHGDKRDVLFEVRPTRSV